MEDNKPKTLAEACERIEDLENRVSLLETQFDDVRIAMEGGESGPRFYAVLRGRFDERLNDFVTGIFNSKEEYDGAVLGATRAKAKSKSTYEKAVDYYEENIEVVEIENTTFRNEVGLYSPQWYVVYPAQPGEAPIHIVPTFDDANFYVKGSSTYRMKRYKTFTEAASRRAQELDLVQG